MELAIAAASAAGSFIASNAALLSVAWTIGSGLISSFLTDPVKMKGPRLNDLRVSSSTYGLKLTQLYGTVRLHTNMIWSAGIDEKKKTQTQGGGLFGKGGGQSQSMTTYSYSLDAAYGIGEPCDTVLRIWANKKVIYDTRQNVKLTKKYKNMDVRFYNGAEDQLPDPTMQAKDGVEFTPAYRGLSYVFIENLPLEDFGNAPPQIEVEAVRNAAPNAHFAEQMVNTVNGFDDYEHNLVVDPDRMLMYGLAIEGGNNQVQKFDILGNQFLGETSAAQDISNSGGHDYDSDGFLIALHTTGFGVRTPVRIDPTTGQIAQSGVESFGLLFLRVDRNSSFGTVWCMDGTALGDPTIHIFDKNLGHIIGVDINALGYGRSRGFGAIDLEGNAWTMTTTSHLLKITPSGSVTPYDLSGTFAPSGIPPSTGYDPTENVVLITSSNDIHKFDIATGTITDMVTVSGLLSGPGGTSADGKFWLIASSAFVEFTVASMSVTRTIAWTSINGGHTGGYIGVVYVPQTNSLVADWQTGLTATQRGWDNIYLDRQAADTMTLAQVVDEISTGRPEAFLKGAGLEDSLIDVSALTDIVDGYFSAKLEPGRALLEQLRLAYFFDGVESDGRMKFTKRGGAAVYTIPASELAAHERGQELPDPVTTTRGQETELPRRVSLTFMDKDNDYLEAIQYSGRLITEAVNEVNVELPLVLTNDHGRQITEILMAEQWAARNMREIKLTNKYADLDAADPIEVAA